MREQIKPIVNRYTNGYESGVRSVMVCGDVTESEARKVVDLYLKEKIAKIDVGVGAFNVKHGAYLDSDVIARAVAA